MSYAYSLKKSAQWFGLAALVSGAAAAGMFYYVSTHPFGGRILGEQAGGLALTGGNVRLVKAANSPTVYALVGDFKYPVRNEEVFKSYGFTFPSVQTIAPAELEKKRLVTLARDAESGRVYFLHWGRNLKKYHPTPKHFAAYGGNRWEEVVTLNATDLSYWQEAVVLKTADDKNVYLVDGDKKALIPDEAAFNGAGLSWDRLMTVSAADLNAYAAVDFTPALAQQVRSRTIGGGMDNGTPQPTPTGTGQLIVTLDQSSPAATVIPYATARNTVASYRLRAEGGKVELNGVSLMKRGIAPDSAIVRVAVFDANGALYGTTERLAEGRANVSFRNRPFVIPRGGEKTMVIAVDFATAGAHNDTIAFSIAQPADLQTAAGVSGIFPLAGNEHKLVVVNDFVGTAAVAGASISDANRDITIGTRKEEVARFTVRETSGNEDIAIQSLTLTNEGTAQSDDIDYITLYRNGRPHATVRDMAERTVTFNLERPIVVKRNDAAELAVKADVLKGEGRTLKFVIAKPTDLTIVGQRQNFNLVATAAEGWPVGRGTGADFNKVTFKREGIGLFGTKLKDAEKEIYRGTENITFAEFELRNLGQDIYLQHARLKIETFNGAPALTGDIAIQEAKAADAIATVDGARLGGGTVDVDLNNYQIAADKTARITITGAVPETAESNHAYRFSIEQLTYKIGTDNTAYTHDYLAIGQLMRVYAPRLAVSAGAPETPVTAGKDGVVLGSFTLTAGPEERLTVTDVTVSLTNGSDDLRYTGGFENVALYIGNRRVSRPVEEPNQRTFSYSDLRIGVSAGRETTVELRADTEIISSGRIEVKLDDVQAYGGHSKAPVIITGEGAVSGAVTVTPAAEGNE